MEPSFHVPAGTQANLTWSCYDDTDPHCSNVAPPGDAFPLARGIYLGSDFSWTACTSPAMTDADLDGVGDFCEYQIALVFRPLLATSSTDMFLEREEYWAVTKTLDDELAIAYLFGWHTDGGCDLPVSACDGHYGDSEFLIAYVIFNDDTQHWELDRQRFSAHYLEDYPGADKTTVYSSKAMEFPIRTRYYSRVWVSHKKHANYNTRAACEAASIWIPVPPFEVDQDDCSANSDSERFDVDYYHNVGSHWSTSTRFIDQTTSTRPGREGTEWFWTNHRFCGWTTTSTIRPDGTCSTSYSQILNTFMVPN